MVTTFKKSLVIASIVLLAMNPMLIDTAEAVEVIGSDGNSGDEAAIISASDRLPGNFQFQTASTRLSATRLPATADSPTHRAPSPDSFILGSRSFSIPFTIDQAADGPVEVHLFAAQADGQETQWNWIEAKQSGNSNSQQFEFTADSDGEFWFATWTTQASANSSRKKPASGEIQPQRKIFVDTTNPSIEITADCDGDGRISLSAIVDDVTPIGSVVLQYITDQMDEAKTLDANSLASGNTIRFQPSGQWQQLSIQLIATDKAGNRGVANQTVRRPRIAATARPATATPATAPGPRYADSSLAPWSGQSVPYRRQYAAAADLGSRVPENILPPPATPDQISNTFGLTAPEKAAPRTNNSPPLPETVPAPTPSADPKIDLDKYRSRSLKEALRPLSEQSRVPQRDIKKESKPDRAAARRPTVPMISRVPVRYSDSERFSLDYVLEAVDARGVEAVELYGSVDEGASWKLWGRDPDRQSPFDIETREEGVFSYRIVVVGRSGLASTRPLAGDLPDMVVVVDKQAPEVRISGARYGEGDRIGALVIRYDVVDANLKERPITLAFSENPDGPWTTVAGGLRNDGDYVWPADPGLPRAFYLRLDAMDKAGNVGTYILDKPIDAQGLAPRARIRGFQTLSGN